MKFLCALLLFVSSSVFAQSGYYYFTSLGNVREGSQQIRQVYVSYEFYADSKPICPMIYLFLDLNFPNFDYILVNGSGCILAGPFTTQEEAKKARERVVSNHRNFNARNRRVTNIIYKERRSLSIEGPG